MPPVKQTPRISVNKLAQFATSKSARQREILYDQKYPTDFKGPYYKEAEEAVQLAIASNLEDLSAPEKTLNILKQMTPEKLGTQRRITSNIGALEAFLEMVDQIDLQGASVALGPTSPQRLTIRNVEISVRPELLLTGIGKSKAPLVGAMKIHFPRTFNMDADSAGLVSAVTQEWCKAFPPGDGAIYGPYCGVVDVGSKQYFPGVKSTIARMKEIAAACENIAALWPTI